MLVLSPNHCVAIQNANKGLYLFPVRNDGSKKPHHTGWQEESTNDLTRIEQLWRPNPDALVGIDHDKSGTIAIDPDRHVGGPDGVQAFNALCKAHGIDDPAKLTPMRVLTPSNGMHFYFRNHPNDPSAIA